MPQLDQVTFFSQFFWLCFFFFTFYFFICKDFLPEMGRILKLRKKKMNFSAEGISSMQQENEKVRASSKTLLENGLNTSSSLLSSHKERIESWLLGVVAETNKKQLQNSNELYIQWVGNNCIRQQIALAAAAPFPTPRIFASLLVEKCQKKDRFAKESAPSWEFRSDSLDALLLEKVSGGKKGGLKK